MSDAFSARANLRQGRQLGKTPLALPEPARLKAVGKCNNVCGNQLADQPSKRLATRPRRDDQPIETRVVRNRCETENR